jgi:cysteinyl-tRNA synthetase
MTLKIYNTLTGSKQEFVPVEEGAVKMYVCGPTVYDLCHMGHARAYVVFDVIRRYLEFKGHKVTFVQNITDVDDKIIKKARELKITPAQLAERYTEEFFKDIDALGIRRASAYPRASAHIKDMINLIQVLLEKGYAYEVNGDVYFSVDRSRNYGKLSHQKKERLKAGARVEVSDKKRDPLDFALWKKAKTGEGEIFWDSPWGRGRPGWHTECSAMAIKYLGNTIDLHGGGIDLLFPHHENELHQAEAFSGTEPFVRFWLHNGLLTIDKEKMSKSLGNFFTIREILEKYPPEVVRFFLLSTHYRSPIDFSAQQLETSKCAHHRIINTIENIKFLLRKYEESGVEGEPGVKAWREPRGGGLSLSECIDRARAKFIKAMDDDFNTCEALAALQELTRELNRALGARSHLEKSTLEKALATYRELGGILGLFHTEEEKPPEPLAAELIELIIDIRGKLRACEEWAMADEIRAKLHELGIELEDSAEGTRWKRARG